MSAPPWFPPTCRVNRPALFVPDLRSSGPHRGAPGSIPLAVVLALSPLYKWLDRAHCAKWIRTSKTYRCCSGWTPVLFFLASLLLPALLASQGPRAEVHLVRTIPAEQADLTRVADMAASVTGIVAVAQPDDHVVKLFHPDGRTRTIGREGEGPGDFRTPIKLGWDLDTLWVIDGVLQRVSVFRSDGVLIRTTAMPDADALRRRTRTSTSVQFRPVLVGVGPARIGVVALITAPNEERDPLGNQGRAKGSALYGVDLRSGGGLTYLGRQPRSESIECRVRVDNSSSSFGFRLPWCSEGEFALGPTGAWLASATPERTSVASDFIVHVELRSRRGIVTYAVDLPMGTAAIPSAEVDRMRAAITGRRTVPPSLRQAIRDTEFPAHFPPVDGLLVSELGEVWLRRPVDVAGSEWIVLGPDGGRRATVRFPDGVEPRFIGKDSVWGTSRSEFDELSLVEFEVRLDP